MARTRRQHRISLILFVLLAAATCLGLGWWQWQRFESSAGTYQNLGYALQWPLFAVFFVYGYRRFVQLERQHAEDLEQEAGGTTLTAPADDQLASIRAAQESASAAKATTATEKRPAQKHPATEIPAGVLPARPATPMAAADLRDPDDPENRAMLEYNDYLARLAARDTERTTR
ncbi:transcriptional regulator [Rhodococcus sp. D2-41]|uniref:Transcriptional regulator n=1 Tax=Speluncibacter jeojiensis TaxID=2710754 RepID=A0A9X4LZ33_9ACTN|nr:transcriptional regulator [Rhodococcus sp. D2-41]MDG3008640.1 transcriptional regulator [Rhodococcus sp. D2-41]MDG3013152.1 transcriptional regulator [Corynebacteriales bacterium D3-21]